MRIQFNDLPRPFVDHVWKVFGLDKDIHEVQEEWNNLSHSKKKEILADAYDDLQMQFYPCEELFRHIDDFDDEPDEYDEDDPDVEAQPDEPA